MWLVPRTQRAGGDRVVVPELVRDALVRWYRGDGSEADHRAAVTLIVKTRAAHRWLACDCRGEAATPLLSPAYLSEAETYYLRRLTGRRRARPEHRLDCPFFREQVPIRLREGKAGERRALTAPEGYFSAHRLAPEKLATSPADQDPDDRSRGVAVPRLAQLLWRLMTRAGLDRLPPLPRDRGGHDDLAAGFAALRRAAEGIEIAPGTALARHLYTHIAPFERRVVFARLRAAADAWPGGHAPQAFLLLHAAHVSGATLSLAQGAALTLRNRVQHPGGATGPYLALVVVGEHSPRVGLDALRGYAQPVAGAGSLFPVADMVQREVHARLVRLQYRLRRRMIALTAARPLFAIDTQRGPIQPDLALALRDHRTGELIDIVLTIASAAPTEAEQQRHAALANGREAILLTAEAVADGELEAALAARLGLAPNSLGG